MKRRTCVSRVVLVMAALAAGARSAGGTPEPGKSFTLAEPALALLWIAPGEFLLGSPVDENSRGTDEGPQTRVKITQGFWLGRTEVTQAQWRAMMGINPSRFRGDTLPVEQVSWRDAVEFCRRVTERERAAGRLPVGYVYVLPTEAQWEFAAKAGASGAFAEKVDDIAWHDQNSGPSTHPVATKKPNAWGLYDMLGNVWEWCADWYAPYPGGAATDYAGPAVGTAKASRGGSWWAGPRGARPTNRYRDMPQNGNDDLGFRLALVAAR
jgi:formylglycine-generating enzyme required for sulfatase activity